jgi:hypothetical protein
MCTCTTREVCLCSVYAHETCSFRMNLYKIIGILIVFIIYAFKMHIFFRLVIYAMGSLFIFHISFDSFRSLVYYNIIV